CLRYINSVTALVVPFCYFAGRSAAKGTHGSNIREAALSKAYVSGSAVRSPDDIDGLVCRVGICQAPETIGRNNRISGHWKRIGAQVGIRQSKTCRLPEVRG